MSMNKRKALLPFLSLLLILSGCSGKETSSPLQESPKSKDIPTSVTKDPVTIKMYHKGGQSPTKNLKIISLSR